MTSMAAAMGAAMMVWVVLGIIALMTMLALGVGMVQHLTGSTAARAIPAAPQEGSHAVVVDDPLVTDAIRASDADRERVATILREGTAAGRLTTREFDERVAAVYSVRTVGELRALVADLPREQ